LSNKNSLYIGEILAGRYRIADMLGEGGMGKVYLAEDLKLKGKKWAVKQCGAMPGNIGQFIDEAEILMTLNHPYLPNIADYYLPEPSDHVGNGYLIMDFIEGQTLQQLFQDQHQQLPVELIVKFSVQICDLFHYLHHRKPSPIIYRDLKPSNIMIDQHHNVRLIDFGTARNYKTGQSSDTIPLGTIAFAAPEQFENDQSDERTDLYTLGALMYFLLSRGKYYFTTRQRLEMIDGRLQKDLADIVHKLLMLNPADRYQEAIEVKHDLERWMGKIADSSDRTGTTQIRERSKTPENKVALILGMYAGAGATFATIAISKALDDWGVAHAVVEYPVNTAEHYALLFGDKYAPPGYVFEADKWLFNTTRETAKPWIEGHTAWYPIHPDDSRYRGVWTMDHTFRMLYTIKSPLTLIDISDVWEVPELDSLFKTADEIFIVVDPQPTKWNATMMQRMKDTLDKLIKCGKSVHLIANRDHLFAARKQWLQSLPLTPLCSIPDIAYSEVVDALWRGRPVQGTNEVKAKLIQSLQPLLNRLAPGNRSQLARRGAALRSRVQGIFKKSRWNG
jgi:hypothetical protein